MAFLSSLIKILCILIALSQVHDAKGANKGTVMVFGGNGFVGRRICEEAVARSYRVISVSRSGCPHVWRNESWARKIEWYRADALNIDSFKKQMIAREPVAVFTMMGTASPYKQMTSSHDAIFEFAGTTNINVCNMASNVKSIKKFVYIGADVKNIGVDPSKANNSFAFWTQLWFGQYKAKLAVERCVNDKFGDNGISFRPGLMAGIEKQKIFGNLLEFNRLPFYENHSIRKFYKLMIPDLISVNELAKDALDFVEGKDVNKYHCPHSKEKEEEISAVAKTILQNVDTIIVSVAVIFGVFVVMQCIT